MYGFNYLTCAGVALLEGKARLKRSQFRRDSQPAPWPVNGRLADPVASATSTTPSTAPITTTPDSIANPGRNSSSQLQWLASAPCGLALEPKTRPHGRERTPSARWWAGGWPLQVRPLPAPPMHPKSATQNPEKESCMPKREEETWVADLVFVDPSTLSGRFDSC
ncbi:hypothetical protein A9K55_006147 [Cordyceps militaris]|uniref:Uncharacterized protein n=1 Tax=Cordyceps militaris TaxID=73501 RepID=A0A2H4SAN0_CORMI|nr:hypothetical protein A9K55_006147 [Cordyceps militaris]